MNYGIPADYEELERRGIDIRGKIALAPKKTGIDLLTRYPGA